jgi:hypothetical protein
VKLIESFVHLGWVTEFVPAVTISESGGHSIAKQTTETPRKRRSKLISGKWRFQEIKGKVLLIGPKETEQLP